MSAVAHISEYKKGTFYSDEYRGSMSWNGYENNVLLRNEGCNDDGTPRFVDVAMALGADDVGDARGISLIDYDNDGDLDIAVNHNIGDDGKTTAPAKLLANDIGHSRSWLAVELEGTASNRDAVGAVVTLHAGGQGQMRLLTAGSSYASQHSDRLYFGLNEAERVESLTVRWPAGGEETFTDLAARRLLRITEGEGVEVAVLPTLGTGSSGEQEEVAGP